jgi:hypothetical protein
MLKTAFSFLAASVIFASCIKTDLNGNGSLSQTTSNDLTFPTANEFSNCKLRRIVHEHGGVPELIVNGLFTYNAAGNPYSLTYGDQTGTGNPNYYFFYDTKGRLREYHVGYSPDDPVEAEWHKYGYNANNQLIVDSTVSAPLFAEDGTLYPGGGDTIVSTLTYDTQGRIIKESIRNTRTGAVRNPTYTYDSRGNLAVAGWKSSSYDYNKVSIYRAHPVFQFIHRNYSKNNAAPQPKYNSKGLPLSNAPSNDTFFNAYATLTGGTGVLKAIYDCN